MESIKKINKICKEVRRLTEEDFTAVLDMATKQAEYTHPLKMATASKINNTGDYNFMVIEGLRKLKNIIDNKSF